MVMYHFGQLRIQSFFHSLTLRDYVRVARGRSIRCFFSISSITHSPYIAHTEAGFLLVFPAISFFSALNISFSCLSCFSPVRGYTFGHSSVHCILLS